MRKATKVKAAFTLGFLGLLLFFIGFIISVYPIFEDACKSKAESIGTDITSKEVNKVMTNFAYYDLVYIERGDTGEITMIKTKIVPINNIISEVCSNIKNSIDKTGDILVEINIGKITGIDVLSKIGPRFSVKMETTGKVEAKLNSEFIESGINQTLHRIYLDVNTDINIITPFNVIGSSYKTRVLLAESIIVGKVPDG